MSGIKHKNLLSDIKMGKNMLTFGDIEIERNNFYHHESPIFKKDVAIEKVSNKTSSGEKSYKYFSGYWCNDRKVMPLHIRLPKKALM